MVVIFGAFFIFVVGAVVFFVAGSFDYWWLLLDILSGPGNR